MSGDSAARLTDLVRAVRSGRGAVLMDLDGIAVEQATGGGEGDPEVLAGEYAGAIRQTLALATELDLGRPRTYTVRAAERQVGFAFVRDDLVLGLEAGPAGLPGQIRHTLVEALGQFGEP